MCKTIEFKAIDIFSKIRVANIGKGICAITTNLLTSQACTLLRGIIDEYHKEENRHINLHEWYYEKESRQIENIAIVYFDIDLSGHL